MIDLKSSQKIQSTFFTIFLIGIIGRIIVKSEFKMKLSVKMNVSIVTGHTLSTDLKISPKLITRNCHLSKYFYKIPLNYTYCDFIYCLNTVLHKYIIIKSVYMNFKFFYC